MNKKIKKNIIKMKDKSLIIVKPTKTYLRFCKRCGLISYVKSKSNKPICEICRKNKKIKK